MVEAVGPHVWYVMLNAKEGPFADVRVRQAVNYAVNKESLVNDVLQGTAEVSAGPIPCQVSENTCTMAMTRRAAAANTAPPLQTAS